MPRFKHTAATCAVIMLSLISSACYLTTQGRELFRYTFSAQPIEKLLNDPELESAQRDFLSDVQEIRRFATDVLHLKANRNYTRYVPIGRDYLALVVSASPPLAFDNYEWRYPVLGAMPYRGYFNAEDAARERDRLTAEGYDVWIRKVDAFSTLGILPDPLYSYMADYPLASLAEMLIHEQVHATLFIKGAVQFNEELATFIGIEGSRLFMQSRNDRDELNNGETRAEQSSRDIDRKHYIAWVLDLKARLTAMYASDLTEEEKKTRKAEMIAEDQRRFAESRETMFTTDLYSGYAEIAVNNAFLNLYGLYTQDLDLFQTLHSYCGGDIEKSTAILLSLPYNRKNPKASLRDYVASLP